MKKILLLAVITVFSQIALAKAEYIQGRDYKVLDNPLPLQKSGRKEVLEFFSYACGHCADLYPELIKWEHNKKPKDVDLYQIPALGGLWTFVGRVKLTAEKLELGDDFSKTYFDLIHKKHQRKYLGNKDAAFALLAKFAKIDKDEVEKAWNSLEVKNNMQKSTKMAQELKITGVPTIVVNGKYVVALSIDGPKRLLDIVDFLLDIDDKK